MKSKNSLFLLRSLCAGILLLLFSCAHKEPSVSFYYWKTNFTLSASEKEACHHFKTKEIYLRFFDVDKKDDSFVPLGILQEPICIPEKWSVTPVIFITNRCFRKMEEKKTRELARKVFEKVNRMAMDNRIALQTIQIDCDWSEETREAYFLFLRTIKNLSQNHWEISATIRLHQIKYAFKTGIPPVDKGMLMFYNMGRLNRSDSVNSIYNETDAKKYISYIKPYPLSLDVAFPIFSWYIQFRNGKIINLIAKHTLQTSDTNTFVPSGKKNTYSLKTSYYKEKDILKLEQVPPEELIRAARDLATHLPHKKTKLVFFDLDEYNLNYYTYEKLDQIWTAFN